MTNRVTPGKVVLGELGGIETGIRQLIRKRPLQTRRVTIPSGHELTVPTADETLRVKGFLVVRRNRTRDYLDVAALSDRYGLDRSAGVLASIDDYYADQHGCDDGVASQLQVQLAEPRPADSSTTRQLSRYKNLAPRWHDWAAVTAICHQLAERMLGG